MSGTSIIAQIFVPLRVKLLGAHCMTRRVCTIITVRVRPSISS